MRGWTRRRRLGGWTVSAVEPGSVEPDPPARAWNDRAWMPPFDDDPDPVTSITLMPEYGVELPLWGADWWQLDLPAELLDVLADWQEQFDINFHPETGWVSDDLATEWARRGDELAAALRNTLPPTVPLRVDLWPVAPPRRRRWFNRRPR